MLDGKITGVCVEAVDFFSGGCGELYSDGGIA